MAPRFRSGLVRTTASLTLARPRRALLLAIAASAGLVGCASSGVPADAMGSPEHVVTAVLTTDASCGCDRDQ